MSLSLQYLESGYVVINRKVMSVLGPNEAIVIGELVNLISLGEAEEENIYFEGKYWIHKSYNDLQKEIFTYFSIRTLQRIFYKLEDIGILLKRYSDKNKFDRTLYTTIDFDKLNEVVFNK